MAKIKFSSIGITSILGKAGGSVYSRNKGGSYFKNFVMPSNPRTIAQQTVRALFGAIAQAWRSLTAAQREAWNQGAVNFPYQDAFGDSKTLTGSQLHQKLNLNLGGSGQSSISDIPSPKSVPAVIDFANATANIDDLEFTVNGDLSIASIGSSVAILEATPPQSAGVSNFGSKYRQIALDTIANAETVFSFDETTTYAAYVAKFGTPNVGDNISARVKVVADNGEVSTYFTKLVSVVNNP